MAYITRANFRRISYQLNNQKIVKLDDVDNVILCEDIPSIKFDYLNKKEKQKLLAFKEFVLHPEIIFKPEYNKLNTNDTKKYIFESVAAYHFDPDCEKLNQDFNGLLLPDKIKEQGDDKIIEFRHWYRENMHLLEEDKKDIFEMHLLTRFGIHRNEIEIVDKKIQEHENLRTILRKIFVLKSRNCPLNLNHGYVTIPIQKDTNCAFIVLYKSHIRVSALI